MYSCSQQNRRTGVLKSPDLTGIDYLEVLGPLGCGRQLAITMLKDATQLALTPANISITGGTPVQAVAVSPGTADAPLVITVDLDQSGDFSTYSLALVAGPGIAFPPDGFDPQLSTVSFSFKSGCPTPADCLPNDCCPPPPQPEPDINYLAKDYDGFRQVMLDRLAVITPTWTETHAADLGIALVETLAYAADHLSYQQDAVSTEAYLGTARSRISLRRHARLVDYEIGEGCNARVWVTLATTMDGVTVPSGSLFYVRVPGLAPVAVASDTTAQILAASTQPIFASLQDTTLYVAHNQIDFYTWGDANCCLAPGATQATLTGSFPMLAPGSVLVFEEALGPNTGQPEDADVTHRCAVRLTGVTTTDYKQQPLTDPLNDQAITTIAWSEADALPFPLCISSTTDAEHGSVPVANVSIVLGNVIPADHGMWIVNEELGEVPAAPPAPNFNASCSCGTSAPVAAPIPRYRPELANSPLTFSVPYDANASASAFLAEDTAAAVPAISLQSDDITPWVVPAPNRDLLSSGPLDNQFVPEIESDSRVFLRFGDGVHGAAPETGQSFTATYRVGNGTIGNIGRDSLGHVVLPASPLPLSSIRNPLAAAGGVDPEDMEHIRQYAPFAYETQLRCVTEADYGAMAAQTPGVREARGTLRWTGSWYTAFVSIDPVTTLSPQLVDATTGGLNLLRMMGTDLAVEGAIIVGLRIEFSICVDGAHFQGDVYEALMSVFITGDQCSGQSGLLNAANFVFGETVYASPLIAAAQAVDGVSSATLTTFARMDDPSVDGVAAGYLTMGRLEIPRCDNDPNNLDHGVFVLHMGGGK
jgi:hypothetical protein